MSLHRTEQPFLSPAVKWVKDIYHTGLWWDACQPQAGLEGQAPSPRTEGQTWISSELGWEPDKPSGAGRPLWTRSPAC